MYATLKRMIDASEKAPAELKVIAVAESVGCKVSDLRQFEHLMINVSNWIKHSDMTLKSTVHNQNAYNLFYTMFVPNGLSGKIYYANEAKKINHSGSLVGKTVVRKRKSGVMNWSFGKPVHYAEGYILETKLPKLQHVIMANVDQQAVTKCIKAIVRMQRNNISIFETLRRFLFTLRTYKIEREVITVGLPEVKCKVVGYKEPKPK